MSGEIINRSLRIRLYEDAVIDGLARLADDVHAAGAKLSITLWHGGHTESFMRGSYALSPSAIPNAAGEVPKVISRAEIRTLVKCYAEAAKRCVMAGLDAVEIQTATNYLLGSFLNPALNHRTDAYGGSRTNRLRIVVEIARAIRDMIGSAIAVGVRTSVSHNIPNAPVDYDETESLACMHQLAETGLIDWVHIMAGSGYASGDAIPAMHAPRPQLAQLGRQFKRSLPVPVITSGNIRTPGEAEKLLQDDAADVVAMARSWIADPDWGNKALAGEEERIRPCVSCNQGCVGFVWRGIPGTCVLNPRAGRELSLPNSSKTRRYQPLTVVGGGPAGMEVARLAAEAGFSVTLHERGEALGGDLRLAALGPTRQRWLDAIAWWQRALSTLGVKIKTASEYDVAQVDETVIWATGAVPSQTAVLRLRPFLVDGIPGSHGLPHGRELMASKHHLAGNVLVVDEEGGWPAVSLVEWLGKSAETITVVTTERALGEAQLTVTFDLGPLAERLSKLKLKVIPSQHVLDICDGKVALSGGDSLGPFDEIVLSTGTSARALPGDNARVGDCIAPRGIWAATSDAARLIQTLQ